MSKTNKSIKKVTAKKEAHTFYMVFVEGCLSAPKVKHDNYQDAFNESWRLSIKENKKSYVMLAVTQIEMIPQVTKIQKLK